MLEEFWPRLPFAVLLCVHLHRVVGNASVTTSGSYPLIIFFASPTSPNSPTSTPARRKQGQRDGGRYNSITPGILTLTRAKHFSTLKMPSNKRKVREESPVEQTMKQAKKHKMKVEPGPENLFNVLAVSCVHNRVPREFS